MYLIKEEKYAPFIRNIKIFLYAFTYSVFHAFFILFVHLNWYKRRNWRVPNSHVEYDNFRKFQKKYCHSSSLITTNPVNTTFTIYYNTKTLIFLLICSWNWPLLTVFSLRISIIRLVFSNLSFVIDLERNFVGTMNWKPGIIRHLCVSFTHAYFSLLWTSAVGYCHEKCKFSLFRLLFYIESLNWGLFSFGKYKITV